MNKKKMNKAFLTLWPLSGSICDLASQHGQGPGIPCQIFKYLDMKGEYIWSKESLKEIDLKTQSTHGQMDWDLICSNVSPEYVGPLNKNPVSKSMNNVRHRKKGRVIATRSQKGSRTQLVLISNMARKRRTRKNTTTLRFRSESRLNVYA